MSKRNTGRQLVSEWFQKCLMMNQIPGTIILRRIPETINAWISALATTKITSWVPRNTDYKNATLRLSKGRDQKNWEASHTSHIVHHDLISRWFQLHQVHSWSRRINHHYLHGNFERHQLTYAIPPWAYPCWGCNDCRSPWSTCLSGQIRGSSNEWYMQHWCSWSQFTGWMCPHFGI